MEKRLQEVLEKRFHKTLDTCTKEELFHALMEITKEATGNLKRNEGSKKLYYISAEFLIGKLLSNNLINLGLYEETEKVLKSYGYELCEIEELEMEPSLGNGGLTSGCLLPGFYCYAWSSWRRYRTELSFWSVSAEIHQSQTAGIEKSVDHKRKLVKQTVFYL